MSTSSNFRRYLKTICAHLLRAELYLCILLIGCTVGLQGYNLVSPPAVSTETPFEIGEVTLPFQFNSATMIPFLMLPLLGFVIGALFLHHYFSHNGFGYSDRVKMFDRHPHTRFDGKFCAVFAWIAIAVSFVLCVLCSVLHGLHTPWYGLICVASTGYLHCKCAKMFRQRRRQYLHNKKKNKGAA